VRTLASDIRYGFRALRRAPGFALAVIAVLALGIGANTAIFSIVNGVLLRPLPFEKPEEVVRLYHIPPQETFPGIATFSLSPANFYDWKRDARLFESMAIYRFRQFALTGSGQARAIVAGAVGADFFDVVRTQPALGRVFHDEEDSPGRSHVVILSDRFWKTQFGGTTDVIGRTLTLDREGTRFHLVHIPPRSAPKGTGFLLHGHTHVPRDETDPRGVRWLNPGCITRPNRGAPASFAWLTVTRGNAPQWELLRL
jgi:hypothetical protein